MENEEPSPKRPRLTDEDVVNNPLRKPFRLKPHFPHASETGESVPHKFVHTPHVNNHLLRPYLTQPAIDLFYMKVISILEKQGKLSPLQARTSLSQAEIQCTQEESHLKTVCRIAGAMTITFLFAKQQAGTLFSLLKTYSVDSV